MSGLSPDFGQGELNEPLPQLRLPAVLRSLVEMMEVEVVVLARLLCLT